MNSLS